MSYNECYTLLAKWCFNFYTKYENQHSNVVLTDEERQKWFEAVDEFRECNQGELFFGTLYASPMDETLLPTTLLDLWNHMEYCSDNWSIRPIIIGKTTITSNK